MIRIKNGFILIETKNSSYVMKVNAKKALMNLYYGKKIRYVDELDDTVTDEVLSDHNYVMFKNTPEYPERKRGFYDEPCLSARFSDGINDLDLIFVSAKKTADDGLQITLKDRVYKLKVLLKYKVFYESDIIEKSVSVKNEGEKKIVLENFLSGAITLPHSENFVLFNQWGHWANEYRKELTPIPHAKTVIDNNRGVCSGPQHTPFYAVCDKNVTETSGRVWYGFIRYNGNFKIVVEQNSGSVVRVSAGVSDYDTKITLLRGESVELPIIINGFSASGLEKMTVSIYDYEFDYLLPRSRASRAIPIIYNSWYPFEFDVNEEKCLKLIDKVKDLGAELFVIDDGWFDGRTDDKTSLGNWYSDKKRFPHGLEYISRKAHEKGLLFGLWVEPEMVNPGSVIYNEHPEWVLRYPTRTPLEFRHQYVLDMSRDDVTDYVINTVDRIVSENSLDYLKWDMNRYIAETNPEKSDFYFKFSNNVIKVWKFLNEKYPNLLIECCAHGGARTDFGFLPYCDRINRSDNADPIDVLKLHEGFTTYVLPKLAGGAGNIASEVNGINGRKTPLDFRAKLGMTGSMSVGINLLDISDDTFNALKNYLVRFKSMRADLHNSYVYRLKSAFDDKNGNLAIWQYAERTGKAHYVFVFASGVTNRDRLNRIKLRGLDANTKYLCDGKVYHGETLTEYGLNIEPYGDYYAKIIEIKKI